MSRLDAHLHPVDATGILAQLPPSARAADADIKRFAGVYEQAAIADATKRLYKSRFTLFASWCAANGLRAMPVHSEVLRLHVISLAAQHKANSTLRTTLAAVIMAHQALGYPSPMSEELRGTMRSLQSTLDVCGAAPTAISLDMLRQIVARCGQDPYAIRDRALLLVAYFAGMRRSEAVALNRERVHHEELGYRLMVGRTNAAPRHGDRGAAPPRLALPAALDLCPVQALDGWLEIRARWAGGPGLSPESGPLFVALHRGRFRRLHLGDRLAPKDMDRIVKRRAAAAGLDAARLSAASLRAGFYAEAARHGAQPEEILAHAKVRVTERYVRAADAVVPSTPTPSLT